MMPQWISEWFKSTAEYDDTAGDRHLMTDGEFRDEQAARARMFDGIEQRYYEQRIRAVGKDMVG